MDPGSVGEQIIVIWVAAFSMGLIIKLLNRWKEVKKMNSIQSMSLKEIDAAKRKVSGYSREIARYSSLTSNSA